MCLKTYTYNNNIYLPTSGFDGFFILFRRGLYPRVVPIYCVSASVRAVMHWLRRHYNNDNNDVQYYIGI